MPLLLTPAVVLQTYRYSETSKVVRLATRDLGVQSAIAKGASRPKSRFGAGLEFLSEGEAHDLGRFAVAVRLKHDGGRDEEGHRVRG